MFLAVGCSETPQDPDANQTPDTFITSYSIDTAPDSATFYYVTVNWNGTDEDGEPIGYRYWVGTGDTTNTADPSARVRMNFPNTTTTYTFYVETRDNAGQWDSTPASRLIDITEVRDVTEDRFLPNTLAITVPPNGASTSRAVPFTISGVDVDGIVTQFQWAVDSAAGWTTVTPDLIQVSSSSSTITLGPSALTLGAHIAYFRSIDNMGNADPLPLSVSFVVEAGYAPEVGLSVLDGQSFIVPFTAPTLFDFTVTATVTTDFYYSALDSLVVITSAGDTLVTTDTDVNLGDLSSGTYWVDVTAYDIAGNSTSTGHVGFTIVELPAGDGVLCVNGVDWPTYGSQIINIWNSGAPWGSRTNYKCWDLFDTTPLSSVPDMADSLLGTGALPGWMLDTTFFDAVTWFGNNYSGDLAYWTGLDAEIMAYLEMGGNILLPTRFGSSFFFTDLESYCGVDPDSWVSPGADVLTAKVDSLTGISAVSGQSLWEIPMTTNPDNVWIYEAATAAPGMHAGFITLPNGAGGGGAFCYIAGRNYRWTPADVKANVDVILRYYFGVQ